MQIENKKFSDTSKLIDEILKIKKLFEENNVKNVFLFFNDTKYTGGIIVAINNIWCIIKTIINSEMLLSDLLVIDQEMNFGFCIEVEEHAFLFTLLHDLLPCQRPRG